MTHTPKYLTTRQLARMWLVSEATIKRWADAGHLHFTRTVGGHRRFSYEDATRFQTERGLGPTSTAKRRAAATTTTVKPAARVRASVFARLAKEFFDAITDGREEVAATILLNAFLKGVEPAKMFDEALAVAMKRVGKLWHEGEMSVADEHVATGVAVRAVEALGSAVRREHAEVPLAVCCALEDEWHSLAVLCAQVLLESEGWTVKNLGPHTPFFALSDALEKYRPALVCVSSSAHRSLERSAREYEQFRKAAQAHGARIVLGGEGFRDEAIRRRFPADLHADNFRDLLKFIHQQFPRTQA
ncbi:MAG: B12-binding domain-containing protein [Acidobacteria bacterium]|nr:B12-binding domain-containing protein [Acidobacteriota bacterium]